MGTRGNSYLKIAPDLHGFGMNQGQFQMSQGQFSKFSSMLPEHNKVRTQRDRFSMAFIMKTSEITPEGKFTANVRISVIHYIFVTYRYGRILTANCCAR